jgi:hypothetical protein
LTLEREKVEKENGRPMLFFGVFRRKTPKDGKSERCIFFCSFISLDSFARSCIYRYYPLTFCAKQTKITSMKRNFTPSCSGRSIATRQREAVHLVPYSGHHARGGETKKMNSADKKKEIVRKESRVFTKKN